MRLWRGASVYSSMRVLVMMCVIAVLCTTAAADARLDKVAAHEWTSRIEKRDVAGMRRWMTLPLHVDGLWFDAPACTRFSQKPLDITASQFPALVACLAELGAVREEFDDNHDLMYGSGAAGWVVVRDGLVRELHGGMVGGALLLAPNAFTKRMQGIPLPHVIGPDPATLQQMRVAPMNVYVDARICIDETGVLTSVTGRPRGTTSRTYVPVVEAAIRSSWRRRPIEVHGKAMAVCADWLVGWPPW